MGVAKYGGNWVTSSSGSVSTSDWLVMCGTNAGSYLKLANGQSVGTSGAGHSGDSGGLSL